MSKKPLNPLPKRQDSLFTREGLVRPMKLTFMFSDSARVIPITQVGTWQKIDQILSQLAAKGQYLKGNDLRVSDTEGPYAGYTGLMAAAEAGKFKIASDICERSRQPITDEDLMKKAKSGKSLAKILAARGEALRMILKPGIWGTREKELMELWETVPEDAKKRVSIVPCLKEIQRRKYVASHKPVSKLKRRDDPKNKR